MKHNIHFIIGSFLIMSFTLLMTGSIHAQEENDYCIPDYTVVCTTGIQINYVGLEGENYSINNSTECSDDNYGDYTEERAADVFPGNTYSLEVATDYMLHQYSDVKAWIDYNDDGDFDSSEMIANTNGNGLEEDGSSFEFTIPDDIEPGNYRLRVRLVYAFTEFDACSSELHGEVEDYTLEVLELEECETDISAGTPVDSEIETCPNTSFTISVENASEAASGLTRIWQKRADENEAWEDIDNAFSSNYTVTDGVDESTQFRYTVSCGSETEASDIIQVNLITGIDCYCIPEYSQACDYTNGSRITKVNLQGESHLLHNETDCAEDNFADYTDLQAPDLIAGESYLLSISSDFYEPNKQQIKVWIDFNNNGSFEESEQIITTDGLGLNDNGTGNFNFIIPDEVEPGDYRMRIRLVTMQDESDDFGSCSLQTFGEVEDYTIEVIEIDPCDGDVSAGTPEEDEIVICANTEFILSVNDSSEPAEDQERVWQSSPIDEDDWTDLEGITSSTFLVEGGIDEELKFRYKVTCSNSGSTDISEEIYVYLKAVEDCFCIPYNDETDIYFINRVKTSNAIQNIDNTSGFSENGYGDYSESHFIVATAGQEIDFSISSLTSSSYYYRIWLDLNQNSEFDEDEAIISSDGSAANPFMSSYQIPDDIEPGNYRLRIRNAHSGSFPPACGFSAYGEAEDYTLQIIEEPLCDGVSELYANNITSDSAEIHWEDDSNSSGWELIYGDYGFNPETEGNLIENITESSEVLSDLSPNHHYQVYVRTYCSEEGFSPYETAHFHTRCEPTQVPYMLDFEDITPPEFPECTRIVNAGQGNDWETATEGNYAFPSNLITYRNNSENPGNAWFFTAGINLEAGVNYQVSYKYGGRLPEYVEKMKVAYGNYADPEDMEIILADHDNIVGPDEEYSNILFSVSEDGVYYFGFNAYSDVNQRNLYLDDIEIDFGPDCPSPMNVDYSDLTDTSVKINWEENDVEAWAVVYGESGFEPNDDEGERMDITNGIPEAIVEGLEPNTSYDFYVISICDEENQLESNFEDALTLTTTPQAPINNNVCDAFELTMNEACESGYNNLYAYAQDDEPFGSCLNVFHGNNTVWFKFIAPTNGIVTIKKHFDTNDFVPELTVYGGLDNCEEWDGIEEIFCSNSNSQSDIVLDDLVGGETYYIQISGFENAEGDFCLEIEGEMSIDSHEFDNFNFYPNPVENSLVINSLSNVENIEITNLLGQKVIQAQPNSFNFELPVDHLESGVYFMTVQINKATKVYKLIKK